MKTIGLTSAMLCLLTSTALCPGQAAADTAACIQTFHRCFATTPLQGTACTNAFDLCKAQDALHGKTSSDSSAKPKNANVPARFDPMGPEMLEREREYAKRRADQDAEAAKEAYKPTAEEQTLASDLKAREQKKAAIAKAREDAIEQDWRMMGRTYHRKD